MRFGWQLTAVLTMTAGTIFLMWLGEQIDEYGIGNGISLLIMAGILARHARTPAPTLIGPMLKAGSSSAAAAARSAWKPCWCWWLLFVGVVAGVVFITPGPAAHSHPKRQARPRPPRLRRHTAVSALAGQPGRRHAHHLRQQPLALPHDAVQLPGQALSDSGLGGRSSNAVPPRRFVHLQRPLHRLIYFFCYFWTAITFNPKDMADNLKNYGTFIPGYRPGRRTADYLEKVMVRITYVGAGFLAVVAIIPTWCLRDGRQLSAWPASTAAPAC